MSDWISDKVKLGKTDLYAGRLGLGAAYGVPTEAIEVAFEAGCNYFYWGYCWDWLPLLNTTPSPCG